MRELSLHLLDLIENAVRAGACVVRVTVEVRSGDDRLLLAVEDDGPGLPDAPEKVLDPFYTTKSGKRTGLGLSLFRGAAECAGGDFEVARSELGGLAVTAAFGLNHIDRAPLGDLAGTFFTVVMANPAIDFWCRVRCGEEEINVRTAGVVMELGDAAGDDFTVAKAVAGAVRDALSRLPGPARE